VSLCVGAAYVFALSSGGGWTQTQKLVAPDGAANDHFGWTISLHEGLLAVGANENDNQKGIDAGGLYIVFDYCLKYCYISYVSILLYIIDVV
jgi:hypothetical protein